MTQTPTTLIDAWAEADVRTIGGKAESLAAATRVGLRVPPWVVLPAGAHPVTELEQMVDEALSRLGRDGRFAVRSSAVDEDGAAHSFAGQFDSVLDVDASDVLSQVVMIRAGNDAARVKAYRAARGLTVTDMTAPAVIIQRMIAPVAAGVAFSADPVSGRRDIAVIAGVAGLGDALVSGARDSDTWHVARDGAIDARAIVGASPVLNDVQVRSVAALVRSAARHFGVPQDVEWALDDSGLWLLQSRPITSLESLPDPSAPLAVWDDSNIAESYGGVTTPLTFSFARYVYEHVYREFCRMARVPAPRIAALDGDFRRMLGLVRGRIYYQLVSWHRVLASLPGYGLNRAWMEQMMGVREPLPSSIDLGTRQARSVGDRLREWRDFARTLGALARAFSRLDRDVPAFRARLDAALGSEGAVLDAWRADELVAHWRTLEARLLSRWDVPLVNDLAAMIAHGLARSLMARWAGDTDGGLTSAIIASGDALASAEPARRINELGRAAAHDRELVDVLVAGSTRDVARALATRPSARDAIAAYIATWGDRCLDELKLETETLADDPLPLYRAIGWAARNARSSDPATSTSAATATARLDAAVRGHPIRRAVLRRVLASARARIEARETLRLERTRLFGRVRRVFLALGARLRDAGRLATPRDVFWLEVDEVLGAIDGTATTSDLRGLVAIRRAEFATWRTMPRPPARCVTRGIVHEAMHRGVWEAPARNSTATMVDVDADGKIMRRGTPAFPGIVRGRARVITDPRGASLATGDILVAERTDPGWVLLFPAARAVVVERGSLLSHSAIVARELGLPAIVGVPGLTSWLTDGETIEIDGALGTVRRIAEASDAE